MHGIFVFDALMCIVYAVGVMVDNNHISGVLEPSGDDMLVTKRIILNFSTKLH